MPEIVPFSGDTILKTIISSPFTSFQKEGIQYLNLPINLKFTLRLVLNMMFHHLHIPQSSITVLPKQIPHNHILISTCADSTIISIICRTKWLFIIRIFNPNLANIINTSETGSPLPKPSLSASYQYSIGAGLKQPNLNCLNLQYAHYCPLSKFHNHLHIPNRNNHHYNLLPNFLLIQLSHLHIDHIHQL